MSELARIPSDPGVRALGVVHWVLCWIAAKVWRVPRIHLFTTLGQRKPLLWAWMPIGGLLLHSRKLPRRDTELVILRVGHRRQSEYELQQHRRLALRRGVDTATQAKIFEGPAAEGLTDRQRTMLTATDELIDGRNLSDDAWASLSRHLNHPQLIHFVTLVTQYDALAAWLSTLRVPLDFPE
jgi:alkylhydroperoxidase family enzyme